MLQKQVPAWVLAVVIGALLLIFGVGSAIHSAGWSDGFMMGLLAGGNADGNSIAPYLAYQAGHGWHGGGIGSFVGGLFRFLFFLFVIGLILRFFGFCRWKMHGPHHWGPREGGHHYGWGPHAWRQPGPTDGPSQGDSTQDVPKPQESVNL